VLGLKGVLRSVEAVCPRPAQRGEGKGEGSVFTAGPLTRRAFGSPASPPFGCEAKIFASQARLSWGSIRPSAEVVGWTVR